MTTAATAPTPAPVSVSVPAPSVPSHSDAFRRRRFLNWFPLGLAYALLYMGRYNITAAKSALGSLMTLEDFGVIFGFGTLVYGVVFVVNGPLTDKIGGKKAMLTAIVGVVVSNILMGVFLLRATAGKAQGMNLRLAFSLLYAMNMYFQSFGAVAIVKVNAYWFHVRERGGFGGIFGTMISSGIFLAFTVNAWIIDLAKPGSGPAGPRDAVWAFFVPAALLAIIGAVEVFLLRDRPSQAGHADFDTGDASSGDDGSPVPIRQIIWRILSNPIILTVALIEFCTGVLRQGIMQWLPLFTGEVLALPNTHFLRNGSWGSYWTVLVAFAVAAGFFVLSTRVQGRRRAWFIISGAVCGLAPFFQGGWGGIQFVAGVIGGNVAGWVSDLFFQSRRGPAAGGLYVGMVAALFGLVFALGDTTTQVAWANQDGKAKTLGLDQLEKGDRIVSVGGRSDLRSWKDVKRAVACYPAACAKGARFNAKSCSCTSGAEPATTATVEVATAGIIPARVMRDGTELELRLRDPAVNQASDGQKSWRMRAGESRKLPAGPVSTRSPIWLFLVAFIMSTCVIGTHGMLSGTATMDFGGRKGAATAVGMIDGFVYLGSSLEAFALGYLTTRSWAYWPLFLLPFAAIGFILTTRIWHAVPNRKPAH